MAVDDLPLDAPSFRHLLPKRRVANSKLRRYRHTYRGNGFLNKVLIWENDPYFMTYDDWWTYVAARAELEKVDGAVARSGAGGLPYSGVLYSQGKKRRWEVAKELKRETPEPEYLTTSSTVVQIERIRTDSWQDNGSFIHFLYFGRRTADLRGRALNPLERMKKFAAKTKTGEEIEGAGKLPSNTPTTPRTESSTDPQLHVEYQILDFRMNRKLHNSQFFTTRRKSRLLLSRLPEAEGHRLGYDVVRDWGGVYRTGDREQPGKVWRDEHAFFHGFDTDEEEEEEEEESVQEGVSHQLTLGDFIVPCCGPANKKERRRKARRRLSDSWDLLVEPVHPVVPTWLPERPFDGGERWQHTHFKTRDCGWICGPRAPPPKPRVSSSRGRGRGRGRGGSRGGGRGRGALHRPADTYAPPLFVL